MKTVSELNLAKAEISQLKALLDANGMKQSKSKHPMTEESMARIELTEAIDDAADSYAFNHTKPFDNVNYNKSVRDFTSGAQWLYEYLIKNI